MRVFVTGASGWIGSAVVPELLGAGHEVVGLARSEESARALVAAGSAVHRGSLEDLDSLRAGAEGADGVIHLAFIHDFSRYQAAVATDLAAVETLGAALRGSDRPLLIASGTLGLAAGRVATELDLPDPALPRAGAAHAALSLATQGVRSGVVRLPPTVHGDGDHGFMATLVDVARRRGASGYVGDGANAWSAVHRLDAARLVRLALEAAPPGSVLHAVAEQGIATRVIAEVIGRRLGVPVVGVAPGDAPEHFGWIGPLFGLDASASSERTRALLHWDPTHPGLVRDLEQDHYFVPGGT